MAALALVPVTARSFSPAPGQRRSSRGPEPAPPAGIAAPAADSGPAARLILSPHLDDAVLSCGGAIHHWVAAGDDVLVVNVMTGDPTSTALSAFAGQLHARWGLSPREASARRRSEDAAALEHLGARHVHLGLLDCIYRRSGATAMYDSEEALYAGVHPSDAPTARRIADELRARLAVLPDRTQVYAPLGAGGHADHVLVRRAAEALFARLLYYEDYPYSALPGAVDRALAAGAIRAPAGAVDRALAAGAIRAPAGAVDRALAAGAATAHVCQLDRDDVRAKVRAVACYASQIDVLFGSPFVMARRVVRDARRSAGRAGYAERFWQPPAARTTRAVA